MHKKFEAIAKYAYDDLTFSEFPSFRHPYAILGDVSRLSSLIDYPLGVFRLMLCLGAGEHYILTPFLDLYSLDRRQWTNL